MDYLAGIKSGSRESIRKGTTLPAFQLACREALRHNLVGNRDFVHLLYGNIPNWVPRNEARDDSDIVRRFKACFDSVDKRIAREADRLLHPRGWCDGRFRGWARMTGREFARENLTPANLRKCLDALLRPRNDPVEEVGKLLFQHKGRIPGFRFGGFSELCYMCNDELFPVLNKAVTIPQESVSELKRKCGIRETEYQGYPYMATRLREFMDSLGFPKQRRFTYMDRYATHGIEGEKYVSKRALSSFHDELEAFVSGLPERTADRSTLPHGWGGEGREHRKLKKFVLRNPNKVGITDVVDAIQEHLFRCSGDKVDVLFRLTRGRDVVVEVETDHPYPGCHQAVKYRVLRCCERDLPLDSSKVSATVVAWDFDEGCKRFGRKYGVKLVKAVAP